MALAPGTRIGSYEVTAQIGVGGMGEVYRATDTNLGRAVAIKVLPEAVAGDAERLARFDREARTLASLNHPNIAQIHGLEKSGGQTALVMELVEGPTLADRIVAGPVPVDEALAIAKQIAEALEAAHEQGIVHRDLKPANVKVRPDGTVKVLDFGLAKAMDPVGAMSPGLTQSPTITTPAMTQAGLILGTAAYMSPEQARGKAVDRRADVWAFGCVLFEMLSGQRAFEDEDVSLTLSKVLRLDPAFDALPPDVPARVTQVLRVCLLKDPRQRASDIHDVRLALEGAFETVVTQSAATLSAPADDRPLWRRGLSYAVAIALTAAAVGLTVWALTRPAPPRIARLPILTTPPPVMEPGGVPDLAISPDGSRVVYDGGDSRLYVRELGQLEAAPLRGGDGRWPFFSPDGNWVGFWSPGNPPGLRKVPISGGPAQAITVSQGFDGATWGADDTIIFAMRGRATGLFRVPASGGDAEPLTTLEEGETAHRWPHLLPGGDVVLFTTVKGDDTQNMDIVALDLTTGERHLLIRGGSNPRYVSTGHLVYGVEGTLRAVRFDPDTLAVSGDPVPVLEDVLTQSSGAVHYGLASDGSLVYLPGGDAGGQERTLVWLDREGKESPAEITETRAFGVPRLSPDGTRLAVDDDGGDVWVSELALGTLRRLTTDPAVDSDPLWTPDGERVVFASQREGVVGLYAMPWDGGGEVERLLAIEDASAIQPESWAPDGTLAFTYRNATRGLDIGLLPAGGDGEWRPMLDSEDGTFRFVPAFSPDGEWIAYTSNRTGRQEVYVRRFPDLRGEQLISGAGGFVPTWSSDGRELFFFSAEEGLVARSVEVGVSSLRVTEGDTIVSQQAPNTHFLFGFTGRLYDVSADGQRVLVSRPVDERQETEGPLSIVLVQHWIDELERLVPNE